jgi:iron(III) transport system ATP-binding protein
MQVKNLSFFYPNQSNKRGIFPLSFGLNQGTSLAILGESGSGKSTLLACLAGYKNFDSGEVFYGDLKVVEPKNKLLLGHSQIAYVTQQYSLDRFSRVNEILLKPIEFLPEETQEEKIVEILSILDLINERFQKASELSGGQQKRVAIAKAIIHNPEVIILDEPFEGLDIQTRFKLFNYLKKRQEKEGFYLIFATHQPDEAILFSDFTLLFKEGKQVYFGETSDLVLSPNSFYQAQIMGITQIYRDKFFRLNHLKFIPSKKGEYKVLKSFWVEPNSAIIKVKSQANNEILFLNASNIFPEETIGQIKTPDFEGWTLK